MMAVQFMILGFLFGLGCITNSQSESLNPKCIEPPHNTTRCDRGCVPGFYGPYCNKTCSPNCDLACSQVAGHCLTGCDPNWYNSSCTRQCSGHCRGDVCDMRSGDCILGCMEGYYGISCQEKCSDNCTGGACDQFGGCDCLKGVKDKSCYQGCSDNCIDGQCDVIFTGQLKCSKGCNAGTTGAFCQELCPENCLNCDSYSSCIENNGNKDRIKRDSSSHCFTDVGGECLCCRGGWRDNTCSTECPFCTYNYANNVCRSSCEVGYFGDICHLNCSDTCSRGTNTKPVCAKNSGICHSGCLQGYHGDTCKDQCSPTCFGRFCFQNNGTCVKCERNKYGPTCEETCGHCIDGRCGRNGTCNCQPGWYGLRCQDKCSDKCKTNNCRVDIRGYHFCAGECVEGYTGTDCLSECPPGCIQGCDRKHGTCLAQRQTNVQVKEISQESTKQINEFKVQQMITVTVVTSSIAPVILIGIVITIIIVVWRKKRRRRRKRFKEAVQQKLQRSQTISRTASTDTTERKEENDVLLQVPNVSDPMNDLEKTDSVCHNTEDEVGVQEDARKGHKLIRERLHSSWF